MRLRRRQFDEWQTDLHGRKENNQYAESDVRMVDHSQIGINFVDLLFAAVVALVFNILIEADKVQFRENLTSSHYSHFAVALTLTITSWIGYHTSQNSPKFQMAFPNLPLVKFLLDVLMVVTYGGVAVLVGEPKSSDITAAFPEAAGVALSFALYVAWDEVALRMKPPATDAYASALRDAYEPGNRLLTAGMADTSWRRYVTIGCLLLSIGIAVLAFLAPETPAWTWRLDVGLILLLVMFRDLKETAKPTSEETRRRHVIGAVQNGLAGPWSGTFNFGRYFVDGSQPPSMSRLKRLRASWRQQAGISTHIFKWTMFASVLFLIAAGF